MAHRLAPGKSIKWGDMEATALSLTAAELMIIDTHFTLSSDQVSRLLEVLTGITEWHADPGD